MTPEQIEALGPAFADYLTQFLFCCGYTQTFDLLNVYCRGLLSDLKRKTCEPIALYASVAVRTLQEFLRDHVWSFAQARDVLQHHVAHQLPRWPTDDLGTLGIIDETGTVKKGTDTPGVQRQWCAEVGPLPDPPAAAPTGRTPGRRSGAAQPGVLHTAVATLPPAPPDGGGLGVGCQGGAGVGFGLWRPALLADLGVQCGDRGGEVLRIRPAGAGVAGADAACGLRALERGALHPRQQRGGRLPRFPGAALRGADAAHGLVSGDAELFRRAGGPAEGGKIRR